MNFATSAPITLSVLALSIACAGGQSRTSTTPQQAAPNASTATATEAAAGGIPRSVLEKYVGDYQLTPQVTAKVRLNGNTLIREIMGQRQTFTPITETRFKLGAGEVEFATDPSGKVWMVVRHGVEEMRYLKR